VWEAIKFFGENHLCLGVVAAARIGRGVKFLGVTPGYSSAITIWWKPNVPLEIMSQEEPQADVGGSHYSQVRFVQFLIGEELVAKVGIEEADEAVSSGRSSPSKLSTIPEGSHETQTGSPSADGEDALAVYLQHDETQWQRALEETRGQWDDILIECPVEPDQDLDYVPTNLLLPSRPLPPVYTTRSANTECLLAFPGEMAKFLAGSPKLSSNQILVFATDQNGTRRQVVQRDDDVLTPQQVKEHWPEVMEAMHKELKTWLKYKRFSRIDDPCSTHCSRFQRCGLKRC
jgi:transcriptional regulator with XRE-family HTH domain